MLRRIITWCAGGAVYTRKHPQLIMTILLVIVIPIAFIVSGEQFLSAARDNQERLEKDRVGLMHDLFATYMRAVDFDNAHMQTEIDELVRLNPDITEFRIGKEENDGIQVVASHRKTDVGTREENPDIYRLAYINPDQSFITPYAQKGVRYWQSTRLVRAPDGANYIIFTEVSLEAIDLLFADRIMTAYYWLAVLLAIILFLVVRHVRLLDYAYLYNEVRKANEMKDLFTNMIAHELRAPLTAMRGYASLIRENTSVSDDIRSHATRIEHAAERLVLIVTDLLDVARIQSGKLQVVCEKLEVTALITEVIDELHVSADEKRISLAHEGTNTRVEIMGDEKRLHQALTNLVSNAIKYTREGTITLSLEERTDRVEIRVKDTGMGISADDQKKVFAPFFRVESNEMEHITGTGLGMWITKQLTELMGGSIGIESIKGVGTHIVLTLPKRVPGHV